MKTGTYMNERDRSVTTATRWPWRDLQDALFSLLLAMAVVGLGALSAAAQNGVAIGTGNPTADPSAALDVQSTTQGMLFPRMTATQRNAIAAPATGLIVFDTSLNEFFFFDGTQWRQWDDWSRNGSDVYRMGNVGIGVADPAFALDVNGSARVQGYTKLGGDAATPAIRQKLITTNLGAGPSTTIAHGLDQSKIIGTSMRAQTTGGSWVDASETGGTGSKFLWKLTAASYVVSHTAATGGFLANQPIRILITYMQ
ncbi:MAG: hypothetical protein IPM68_04370 [Flavobacteriales bacterium]|nr:hypothetical protein [Flavobacteriales bacterium]